MRAFFTFDIKLFKASLQKNFLRIITSILLFAIRFVDVIYLYDANINPDFKRQSSQFNRNFPQWTDVTMLVCCEYTSRSLYCLSVYQLGKSLPAKVFLCSVRFFIFFSFQLSIFLSLPTITPLWCFIYKAHTRYNKLHTII